MLNRTFITGLAEKCPFYSIPLADCGLASLRGDGVKDGIQKRLENLSDKEIDDLIRHHLLCVCRRDGCDITPSPRLAVGTDDDDLFPED